MTQVATNPVQTIPEKPPRTIWSRGAKELLPERFSSLITIVMPTIYILFVFFGVASAIVPIPTFKDLVGNTIGSYWAICVAFFSLLSFIGLLFKLRVEIYSGIALTFLLAIYAVYVTVLTFDNNSTVGISRLGVIFACMVYPVMPAWRVLDILFTLRKAVLRQLYAKATLGG